MPAKKKPITASQLYTGRRVTIQHGDGPLLEGKVSNGGQCGDTQFAFSGDKGEEDCVARSAIVKLGT